MIPIHVKMLGKLIPILELEDVKNLANGEIEKFNYTDNCKNQHSFNDQVVGSRDGYDMIWRHISNDYFKLIGKFPERKC